MIRGAIFDFDGTLADSMSLWETMGAAYLRGLGKAPEPGLREALRPLSLFQSAVYLKTAYDLPLSEEDIMEGINAAAERFYRETVLPKPGAARWLSEFRDRGIPVGICTATDRPLVEAALRRFGMEEYVSFLLTCTEAGSGKDRPLIFREALRRLGTGREDTVVVEDALHAVRTANADGFVTVGVYDAWEPHPEEVKREAGFYLDGYGDTEPFWAFASRLPI